MKLVFFVSLIALGAQAYNPISGIPPLRGHDGEFLRNCSISTCWAPIPTATRWNDGAATPTETAGSHDGDYYVRRSDGEVFRLLSGAWVDRGWKIVGSAGAKGDQGDVGPAGTIAIHSVTTGAPGTSASVANVGSPSAASLDITIPRGDAGAGADFTTATIGSPYSSTTGAIATSDTYKTAIAKLDGNKQDAITTGAPLSLDKLAHDAAVTASNLGFTFIKWNSTLSKWVTAGIGRSDCTAGLGCPGISQTDGQLIFNFPLTATAATGNTVAVRDNNGNLTIATPTSAAHATTKSYVDGLFASFAPLASPSFSGTVSLGSITTIPTNTGYNCGDHVYNCTSAPTGGRIDLGTSAHKWSVYGTDGYGGVFPDLQFWFDGKRRFGFNSEMTASNSSLALVFWDPSSNASANYGMFNGYGFLGWKELGLAYFSNTAFWPFLAGGQKSMGIASARWTWGYFGAIVATRETSGDSNSPISNAIKFHAVTGTLTASRTKTLPDLATVSEGQEVVVTDETDMAATFNIFVAAAAGQNVNGNPSVPITSNGGVVRVYAVTTTTPKKWRQW